MVCPTHWTTLTPTISSTIFFPYSFASLFLTPASLTTTKSFSQRSLSNSSRNLAPQTCGEARSEARS